MSDEFTVSDMTQKQKEAVLLIHNEVDQEIYCSRFSDLFWPSKRDHQPLHIAQGKWLKAGAWLSKMADKGILSKRYNKRTYQSFYRIGHIGQEYLEELEDA